MQRVRKLIYIDDVHRQGITGNGIGVGVLDSGVAKHEDLKGRITVFRDFLNKGKQNVYDYTGHGTHVCGIIAGDGKSSGRKYCGVAPKCHLCVGCILDKNGEGDVATLIQGMEWLLYIASKYNIRVINISISSLFFAKTEEKERIYRLFQNAYEREILIVTAAGNCGPSQNTVSKLGDNPYAICVGCHEGKDSHLFDAACQHCSGRGPGSFVYRKPDIVAPGTDIVSCSTNKQQYIKKSGTSMATPIISGAVALFCEKYPYMHAEEIKRRLIFTADDLGENYLVQGFGMINVKKLLTQG